MHQKSWFSMENPKMKTFCHLELPSISMCQVARRTGKKTLSFAQKFPKIPKLPQISWNLGWSFFIKCYGGTRITSANIRSLSCSLFLFCLFDAFLVHVVQWWKSLSCSYDVTMSVSIMSMQGVCLATCWKREFGTLYFNAKYVPSRKGLWRIGTVGIVECGKNVVQSSEGEDSHLTMFGNWDLRILQVKWEKESDREW